jgi:receptor-type tyrosine-protein phosphatase Q
MQLIAFLAIAVSIACTSSQNLTYQEGAAGSEATLLSIGSVQQSGVFGDDNELLRRIAYTETRDGTLSSTYRSGYHGGIWAVNEDQFLNTKNTTQYRRLPAKFQQIQLHFGINWLNVQWRELRKPLYSALAARLVIYIAPLSIPSADDLPGQAQFWVSHYNRNGDAATFETTSSGLEGEYIIH